MIDKHSTDHSTWGQQCDGWHLLQHPPLSVIHERMPPDSAEVRHLHQHTCQFFFILSGIATVEIAGEVQLLRA